jgi:hypothetical protein
MTRIPILLVAILLCFASHAQAQRTTIPLVNFVAVPTGVQATTAHVRSAIIRGALTQSWDIVEDKDGNFLASAWKDGDYWMKVRVTYDANQYSVSYLDSRELRYEAVRELSRSLTLAKMTGEAEALHGERFKERPETPFAVKTESFIHPSYEFWVRDLVASIRRHLLAPMP